MNMPMFIVFLEKFVNSFNSGNLPSITSAYAALVENEIFEHTKIIHFLKSNNRNPSKSKYANKNYLYSHQDGDFLIFSQT